MPGPVQENSQDCMAGRGRSKLVEKFHHNWRCSFMSRGVTSSGIMTRTLPSELGASYPTDRWDCTQTLAEPATWRAATWREQSSGVAYLLNRLVCVWNLMIIWVLTDLIEEMRRILLLADPGRASTWAMPFCHVWSTFGLVRKQACWWQVSITPWNDGTGDCKSQFCRWFQD